MSSIDVYATHPTDPQRHRYARIDDPTGDFIRGVRLATFDAVTNDTIYTVNVRIILDEGDPCVADRTVTIETERRVCSRFLFFRYNCRTPTTQLNMVISSPPR